VEQHGLGDELWTAVDRFDLFLLGQWSGILCWTNVYKGI
jgi:hypothetical protein